MGQTNKISAKVLSMDIRTSAVEGIMKKKVVISSLAICGKFSDVSKGSEA